MARIKFSDRVYFTAVFLLSLAMVVWTFAIYFAILASILQISSIFVNLSTFVLLLFLILLIGRYFLLIWSSYRQHRESFFLQEQTTGDYNPSVTILVPAYNEGAGIEGAIQSLLEMNYPFLDIVVINDGSTDDTLERATRWAGRYRNAELRVITPPENIGKAKALNMGIQHARGEIILCMDGDSRLDSQAVIRGVAHFVDPKVAAVAGNVKIINRNSFLTRLQSLEYIEGLNLVRRAQAYFRCVNIIPGPIGFFRRKILEEVGGYESDTFAEDCDLTVKLLSRGYEVNYEAEAISWTEAPETVSGLFTQRYRWTRGILQALRKHKSSLFHIRGSTFMNSAVLWYMVFESVIWPVMNIFGNIFFLFIAFWYGAVHLLILWWLILTMLDMIAALHAISLEEEELGLVFYAIPYRVFFVLAVDMAKLLSSFEELLGVKMSWGRIERRGRISEKGGA